MQPTTQPLLRLPDLRAMMKNLMAERSLAEMATEIARKTRQPCSISALSHFLTGRRGLKEQSAIANFLNVEKTDFWQLRSVVNTPNRKSPLKEN